MNLVFGVIAAVFGIVSFGLVDSVHADHPDELDSELTFDVRINNCTSFTIFGNTDEINSSIMFDISFEEYIDNSVYGAYHDNYYDYENTKFPNKDGSFEHTITLNNIYNYTNYRFNDGDSHRHTTGEWYIRDTYNRPLPTELYQGHISINLHQYTIIPHGSSWMSYYIGTINKNHTHHANATDHVHVYNNPQYNYHILNVRTNPDTNQLCLYKTELVCSVDDDNHKHYVEYYNRTTGYRQSYNVCDYIEHGQIGQKSLIQITDDKIEKLEAKKDKLKDKKDRWKDKFKVCKNEKSGLKTELNELQSKFTLLETNSNQTQSELNESLFTIEKLTTELNEAKKKIEELDSKELDVQEQYQAPVNEPEPPANLPTLSITIPESTKYDNTDRTIDLYHGINNRMRIDTAYQDGGTAYYIDDKAYIVMFRDTWIINKQFTAGGGQYCYVADLLVGQDAEIPQDHTNTLQLEFRQSVDSARCDGSPDIVFDGKLALTKEIYVRFTGMDGAMPFYHDGANVVNIPKCSNTNFNININQLTDNTEICYGKDGNDTILVSKILTVFGVIG